MAIVNSMAASFKKELFAGGHCFNGTVTLTATIVSGDITVTAVSSMVGIAVGMHVTGAGIDPNAVVAAITGANKFTLSIAATATNNKETLTVAGDQFKMALIKQGMKGNYDSKSVNYTNITGNDDETVGLGYTAGGAALTNVSPAVSGTVAFVNFSPNPSWTDASFTTAGCMIYNSSVRNGGVSGTNDTGGGRCCSVHNLGNQQVVNGTFSVVLPPGDELHAILLLK